MTQVNVLGLDRIVGLIEEAVHRSLKHRLLSIEREAVVDATKEEFLKLLKRNEDLEKSKSDLEQQFERIQEEVDDLRGERERAREELESRLQEASLEKLADYEGENAAIVAAIRESFESGSASNPEHIVSLVMGFVDRERKDATEARAAAEDREVQTLQRRIKKLTKSLEATELKLDEVSQMKDVETGVASVYREVQGLDRSEKQFDKKKALMSTIFEANMKLQNKG